MFKYSQNNGESDVPLKKKLQKNNDVKTTLIIPSKGRKYSLIKFP